MESSSTTSPIRTVAQPYCGRAILSSDQWDSIADMLKLSKREAQILQGLFDDETEAAIALELGISAHTVHTYLERLYRKLGVASRSAAIVRVFGEYIRRDLRTS
jgi:DNA-binding NarL/FixJ family response regulator